MPVAGKPMVDWSVEAFRAAGSVESIVVACPPGLDIELSGQDVVAVEGGATRSDSVSNGLAVVDTELVVVHDAARPLVSPVMIEAVIGALRAHPDADGVVTATPVTDTIKRTTPGRKPTLMPVAEATVDRGQLMAAQTPQAFRAEALREALAAWSGRASHESEQPEGERAAAPTDEAMLIEAAGGTVLLHDSPGINLKVTTPVDLLLAGTLLKRSAQ